jgi:phosphonopyruvate decarboxylase
MTQAAELCSLLQNRDYTFYAAVPCSAFNGTINHILGSAKLELVMAANEGAALGIAVGAWLSGHKPVVMLQNSGVGNLLNPLTSLAIPCHIPLLLLISGRGYPDGSWDEPQHRVIGANLRGLLDQLDIPRFDLSSDPGEAAAIIDQADELLATGRRCVAIIVPNGCLTGGPPPPRWERTFPLTRDDAISIIFDHVDARHPGDAAVISTTGKISRAVFTNHDRAGNFYMQGAMGHARAIALGIARSDPARRVVLLDGDGATLMHMGSLSTVGHHLPPSLLDIVLDNEAHGSTGNQYTTSATTDLAAVAKACNYRGTWYCTTEDELRSALSAALDSNGPNLILVKINRDEPAHLPRVTSAHTPDDMARTFRTFLASGRDDL